jgi:predicted nucleic acid-binding protein
MKKTNSKLLDSSAWLSYFFGENERVKEIVESCSILYTQAISLFEIKRKFLEMSTKKSNSALNFIKERSIILALDEEIAEKAAEVAHETDLHAIDSMICATALVAESTLITLDFDFKGLDQVVIL